MKLGPAVVENSCSSVLTRLKYFPQRVCRTKESGGKDLQRAGRSSDAHASSNSSKPPGRALPAAHLGGQLTFPHADVGRGFQYRILAHPSAGRPSRQWEAF